MDGAIAMNKLCHEFAYATERARKMLQPVSAKVYFNPENYREDIHATINAADAYCQLHDINLLVGYDPARRIGHQVRLEPKDGTDIVQTWGERRSEAVIIAIVAHFRREEARRESEQTAANSSEA